MNANAYTFWAPQLIHALFHQTAAWTGNVIAVIAVFGGTAIPWSVLIRIAGASVDGTSCSR